MHETAYLFDLAVIFGVAVGVVLALGRLGLPPVVGFLVAGVLVGPGGLQLVGDVHQVETLAELGVALLLFTIGLEFSLERLARIARYVAFGGGLQVLLTVGAGVLGALAIGVDWKTGVFWGYLAALSSTAIVLRALADREETAAPHGRFVVGVLIFQDLCIVPMMLTLPMLAGDAGGAGDIGRTLGMAVAVVAGVLLLARRIVPAVFRWVASTRRRELFLLSVLLVALLVATVTASMGLSLALGAFLAGVVIADTEYVHQALSDVSPFRDALASLFFVSIGMLLDPSVLVAEPLPIAWLCVVLLFGKLALATLAGLLMRFPARVALLAGVGIAQVGEFSFVLLDAGQDLGLINEAGSRRFIAASVLTMAATPLLLAASPRIAAGAALLRPLERLLAVRPVEEAPEPEPLRDHVIVAGLGLGGQLLISALESVHVPYVALELNVETVIRERRNGRRLRYGDASSAEVLEHVAEASRARMLVLLLSDPEATRRAAATARAHFPNLHVVVRAHRTARDESDLHELGVEIVSEDYETALEIVERVLYRTGVTGHFLRGAVAAVRHTRTDGGRRLLQAGDVLGAMALDALTLADGDWAVGRSVAGTGLRAATGALVVAVGRGGDVFATPPPEHVLRGGDVVFLFGTRDQLARSSEFLRAGTAAAAGAAATVPR